MTEQPAQPSPYRCGQSQETVDGLLCHLPIHRSCYHQDRSVDGNFVFCTLSGHSLLSQQQEPAPEEFDCIHYPICHKGWELLYCPKKAKGEDCQDYKSRVAISAAAIRQERKIWLGRLEYIEHLLNAHYKTPFDENPPDIPTILKKIEKFRQQQPKKKD